MDHKPFVASLTIDLSPDRTVEKVSFFLRDSPEFGIGMRGTLSTKATQPEIQQAFNLAVRHYAEEIERIWHHYQQMLREHEAKEQPDESTP